MKVEELKRVACEEVDRCAEELNDISQQIWAKPELNYEEHHAHKVLTDYLESKGFRVQRQYKLPTAFRADWGEGDAGSKVAVLCEYDALPEIGHACGHNLIAEAGVAAALAIKAAMQAADAQIGQLTVLGTPAEEGGGGKVKMIDEGVFKEFDVAMMVHPYAFHDSRPCFLGAKQVTVIYHGKASHAAGFPWAGVNALDAAVLCYSSVANLRQQFQPSWRVHAIISKGGTIPNIIPDNTESIYCFRAPTDSELNILQDKLYACFRAAATATGCTVKLVEEPYYYASMVSNGPLADAYDANLKALGTDLTQDPNGAPAGSTDMGNVSHVLPSLHPMYALHCRALNHTKEFTAAAGSAEAQPHTLAQGKALAITALDVMTSPALLASIKAAFEVNKQKF